MTSKGSAGKLAKAIVSSGITIAGAVSGPPSTIDQAKSLGEYSLRQQSSKVRADIHDASRDRGRSGGSSGKK